MISHIQEQVVILVKVLAVKWKRAAEMGIDRMVTMGANLMDVDGKDKLSKCAKSNLGGVVGVNRRGPQVTNLLACRMKQYKRIFVIQFFH